MAGPRPLPDRKRARLPGVVLHLGRPGLFPLFQDRGIWRERRAGWPVGHDDSRGGAQHGLAGPRAGHRRRHGPGREVGRQGLQDGGDDRRRRMRRGLHLGVGDVRQPDGPEQPNRGGGPEPPVGDRRHRGRRRIGQAGGQVPGMRMAERRDRRPRLRGDSGGVRIGAGTGTTVDDHCKHGEGQGRFLHGERNQMAPLHPVRRGNQNCPSRIGRLNHGKQCRYPRRVL